MIQQDVYPHDSSPGKYQMEALFKVITPTPQMIADFALTPTGIDGSWSIGIATTKARKLFIEVYNGCKCWEKAMFQALFFNSAIDYLTKIVDNLEAGESELGNADEKDTFHDEMKGVLDECRKKVFSRIGTIKKIDSIGTSFYDWRH